jgi:hypothetical protein
VTLPILSQLRSLYFRYFSKPQSDSPVYKAIRRHAARKIVELGIGNGRRALRMIEVAKTTSPGHDICYIGMDMFEGRSESDGPRLSLKAAHQLLRRDGVRVQLVPGNPPESLVRVANSLLKIDLLIVPAEMDSPASSRVWFFVPRMLHQRSVVFVERVLDDGRRALRVKPPAEIDELASVGTRRRAA